MTWGNLMATMLDCKKIQPLLSEYVDGVLDGDTGWDVKLHLASCAVCTEVAGELRATAELLRSLPTREPSANFEAALAKRLADKVLTPHRPTLQDRLREWWVGTPRLRPVATSAAVMAAMLPLAFLVTLRDGTPRSADGRPGTEQAIPSTPKATTPGDATVNQLWSEHLSYASTEPLGNGGGMLLPTTSPAPGTDIGL